MNGKIKAVILDSDGVLYDGKKKIAGSSDALKFLNDNNIPHLVLTNTTMQSRKTMSLKIQEKTGYTIDPEKVVTASYLTSQYLKSLGRPKCYLILGGSGRDEFADIPLDNDHPEYVILGDLGYDFNFHVLNKAFLHIRNGAKFVCMQNEPFELGDNGPELNVGAWLSLLEKATGKKAKVLGKPESYAFQYCLKILNTKAKETLVVGDSIYTDIIGAKKLNMKTVLVKTGKYSELKKGEIKTDFTINNVSQLPEILK